MLLLILESILQVPKKYPCLTLSQAISQSFNQSNNQLVIHQSIYQSDNLVSQSVSH